MDTGAAASSESGDLVTERCSGSDMMTMAIYDCRRGVQMRRGGGKVLYRVQRRTMVERLFLQKDPPRNKSQKAVESVFACREMLNLDQKW